MYIKNWLCSFLYKLILVLAGILGLLLNFGVFDGHFNWKLLIYFTILSNILCVLYFILALFHLGNSRRNYLGTPWNPTLKGITTMSITVTLLVAHFLLGSRFDMGTTAGLSLLFVHYIIPIMTLLDWLLFDKKGSIKKTSPLIWTVVPLIYFAYTMVAAQMGGKYPYFFINADSLGWSKVLFNVLALSIFFIALGYIAFAVEKILIKIDK